MSARFAAFATLGAFNVVQELAGAVLESVPGADPEVVAEETLALVAVASARAAEVGGEGDAAAVLLDLPTLYRDYLVGSALLAQRDPALLDANEQVLARLHRKQEFYTAHLPSGAFPGERALTEKLALWMGRVSGPGLPENPDARLARLGLVSVLVNHLKLVLAFARKGAAGA